MNYKPGDLVVYKSHGELEWHYGYCPLKVGILTGWDIPTSYNEFHVFYRNKKEKDNQYWFRLLNDNQVLRVYKGSKSNEIKQIFKLALVMDKAEAWRRMARSI